MIEQLIAEATECDFKVALETKKPKSWLKSVSAFSNGIGGTLIFRYSDDRVENHITWRDVWRRAILAFVHFLIQKQKLQNIADIKTRKKFH